MILIALFEKQKYETCQACCCILKDDSIKTA